MIRVNFKMCWMILPISLIFFAFLTCNGNNDSQKEINLPPMQQPLPEKGELLYQNSLAEPSLVADWIMEGPGELEFENGWMHMHAHSWRWYNWFSNPGHHVIWCPADFPASFIAEWEAQNLEPDAGLCIVFFAARGINGEDIFDPSLPKRNGAFKQYTKGKINSYHISYYANNPTFEKNRRTSNLRKNSGFYLAQTGPEGIPTESTEIHHLRLIKDGAHIMMFVDDRRIIDWTDDGLLHGPVLQGGKIGFRQMRWSHFRYRNFRVWHFKEKE